MMQNSCHHTVCDSSFSSKAQLYYHSVHGISLKDKIFCQASQLLCIVNFANMVKVLVSPIQSLMDVDGLIAHASMCMYE